MKRIFMLLVLLAALPACAGAEYWDESGQSASCREGRRGCQVLQMVMMGSFAGLDFQDGLSVRVHAAALTQLREITHEDCAHFLGEFDVDADTLRVNSYIALGNCLLADIMADPGETAHDQQVRRILRLFLAPETEIGGRDQTRLLREKIDDALIADMARTVALPEDFIRYLIASENWRAGA
ncbi:MAG: hypothetical protein IJD94_02015 [Clostridia bacterium]|nr:hypothetical protein [Clostridia bacterium]